MNVTQNEIVHVVCYRIVPGMKWLERSIGINFASIKKVYVSSLQNFCVCIARSQNDNLLVLIKARGYSLAISQIKCSI